MSTSYTSLLGLALPATGELSGTWGDTVNTSITSLLDSAIAGTTTFVVDADVTLDAATGTGNTARQAILLWNPTGPSAPYNTTRTITAPAQSKIYTVINASSGTQSIILAGAGPTSGVTIAKGESALCAWNGSDFIKISNTAGPGTFTNLTVTGNTSLGDADTDTITQTASYVTGTQLKSAKTATNTLSLAAYDVDGTAYTNLITLTASNTPTLALTSTGVGTINNMSIAGSTGAFTTLSASSTVTLSGGTINGVAYLNGSNVLTTGSALVFDGSNLGVGVTPSAWGSGFKAVENQGGALYSGSTNAILLGQNFIFNGTNNVYKNNGFASAYSQNSGVHAWFIAPSGTGGATPGIVSFTQAMTLDASGNLGVGTPSPSGRLHVNSTGAAIAYIQSTLAAGNTNVETRYVSTNRSWGVGQNIIQTSSIFEIADVTAGATRLAIDSSGKVGIGTSSPIRTLSIANGGPVVEIDPAGIGSANPIYFNYNRTTSVYTTPQYWALAHNWMVSGGTSAMLLDSSGNLGIGATSAGNKLQISNGGANGVEVDVTVSSGTQSKILSINRTTSAYTPLNFDASSFSFQTSGTTKMTLSAAGGLSIKETVDAGAGNILLPGSGGGTIFGNATTSSRSYIELYNVSTGDMSIATTFSTAAIKFLTGGTTTPTERARIDSSGNLIQKGATTAAGIKPTALANNESITTVNSTTYTINLGTSAKLFWIALGNGDGALVFTSYVSSSITFLGITPTTVAATASPSSAQLGISKSANSHDIVIKTGSALSTTAASWQMGVLSSQVA